MAIRCPRCGAEYDVTLFPFGRTIRCDCGASVDLAVGHQQRTISVKHGDHGRIGVLYRLRPPSELDCGRRAINRDAGSGESNMSSNPNLDPKWLRWSRQLMAIAQNGLTYDNNPFDKERYEAIRAMAAEILSDHSGTESSQITDLFSQEVGYATPKVDVRGVVFRDNTIMEAKNLSDGIPTGLSEELITAIHGTGGLRIERIVSQGQSSPEGFWYDQDEHEWVVIIEGRAAVQFEGEAEAIELQRGSYLNIPARARHRVVWTDPDQKTVWLAIHYRA